MDRRGKYWRLGAISEILISQVSSSITDIFHGDSRLDCHENTVEAASPISKKWAREPSLKITTIRMIGRGHFNLKLWWLSMTLHYDTCIKQEILKNTCLQKWKSHRYFSKVHCKVFFKVFEKILGCKFNLFALLHISACVFAFAFKFIYIFAHAHLHAQMYLHSHLHVHSHSLAFAVYIFTCAHFQCIRIRIFIFAALLNCCFCSIYLDIHSSPQNFLLKIFFICIYTLSA